jgi:hypothetical protein
MKNFNKLYSGPINAAGGVSDDFGSTISNNYINPAPPGLPSSSAFNHHDLIMSN